jgi:hypothetical protein
MYQYESLLREQQDELELRRREQDHMEHVRDSAIWAANKIADELVHTYGLSEDAGNTLFDLLVDGLQSRSLSEHDAIVKLIRGVK